MGDEVDEVDDVGSGVIQSGTVKSGGNGTEEAEVQGSPGGAWSWPSEIWLMGCMPQTWKDCRFLKSS